MSTGEPAIMSARRNKIVTSRRIIMAVKTVHYVNVYPADGNPFQEFFSSKENAESFIEFSDEHCGRWGGKSSYGGTKRVIIHDDQYKKTGLYSGMIDNAI